MYVSIIDGYLYIIKVYLTFIFIGSIKFCWSKMILGGLNAILFHKDKSYSIFFKNILIIIK